MALSQDSIDRHLPCLPCESDQEEGIEGGRKGKMMNEK
jgi:hypothetical protein